jgi:hypothetical protein
MSRAKGRIKDTPVLQDTSEYTECNEVPCVTTKQLMNTFGIQSRSLVEETRSMI